MQAANIPHNILVVDCGQRLFLFPNNFSKRKAEGTIPEDVLDTQVDPAAFEMAGHLILKRRQDYDKISQVWPPPFSLPGRAFFSGLSSLILS